MAAIDEACRGVLGAAWVPEPGFTMPNARRYPWQWLWDSCFHAIAWSGLGDRRAVSELESLLALQLESGFVPHMGYQTRPRASLRNWHIPGRSDITQPPMYGHALRVLAERGFAVDHLYEAAARGLDYLFEHRRHRTSGLIRVFHPWETGCDDSNRWDGCLGGRFRRWRWHLEKRRLVHSLQVDDVAIGNPRFDVCSAGFSALVAFNARELGGLAGNRALLARAETLAAALDAQWIEGARTWGDLALAGPRGSTAVRTLDGLLPLLVSSDGRRVDTAFEEIFDPASFWRPFGPAGTSVAEPSYDPNTYWRGPAWPQLTYLVMVAARRRGRTDDATRLADALRRGCVTSGYAEYWNPESGAGRGAIPQGWGALAWEGVLALSPPAPAPAELLRRGPAAAQSPDAPPNVPGDNRPAGGASPGR